jgi:hypothetical protein
VKSRQQAARWRPLFNLNLSIAININGTAFNFGLISRTTEEQADESGHSFSIHIENCI